MAHAQNSTAQSETQINGLVTAFAAFMTETGASAGLGGSWRLAPFPVFARQGLDIFFLPFLASSKFHIFLECFLFRGLECEVETVLTFTSTHSTGLLDF